jgi:hypothetical protein
LESDFELLESYLDGELAVSESEGLWRRLAAEPALAAALDELRAQRTGRLALFESLEPTDQAADALCDRIDRSVRRRRNLEWTHQALRYVTAAAACIVVGFGVGWVERGNGLQGGPGQTTPVQQVIASNQNNAPGGNIGAVPVAIRDVNGNVIAVPQFDSVQQATQFIDDLKTSQTRAQSRDLGSNVVPVSDEQQF